MFIDIFCSTPNLKVLIAGNSSITNQILSLLFRKCKLLTELDVSRFSIVDDWKGLASLKKVVVKSVEAEFVVCECLITSREDLPDHILNMEDFAIGNVKNLEKRKVSEHIT